MNAKLTVHCNGAFSPIPLAPCSLHVDVLKQTELAILRSMKVPPMISLDGVAIAQFLWSDILREYVVIGPSVHDQFPRRR